MQAYMKSSMPYLGVPLPVTRRIARAAAAADPPADVADLLGSADRAVADRRVPRRALCRNRTHRLADGARGGWSCSPLYREMIVTGAWWDHVDGISERIGVLLLAHRPVLEPVIREWSTDPDRWLRRSSIICQLALKQTHRRRPC